MRTPGNSYNNGRCGFTLLELVGVLAILSLLTWVTADGVFRQAKESQRQQEAGRLAEIGSAFARGVGRQRLIPADTNWAHLVAVEMAEPDLRVSRNDAGWNRRLIYDPAFRVGSPLAKPPYAQTLVGSLAPTNARAVFLSTVAADFPSLTSVKFEDLWECPLGRLPDHWSSRWEGQPADLLIERVSFAGQFHQVCLNNLSLDSVVRFTLDDTNQTAVIAARSRWDRYLLADARLVLLAPDGSAQHAELISGPISFAFEGIRWERNIMSGLGSTLAPMAATFEQFTRAPVGPSGIAPGEVERAMYDLLGEYIVWADAGFARALPTVGLPTPQFRRVSEARARLADFSGLILGVSSP